jgi:hypothetical protein
MTQRGNARRHRTINRVAKYLENQNQLKVTQLNRF